MTDLNQKAVQVTITNIQHYVDPDREFDGLPRLQSNDDLDLAFLLTGVRISQKRKVLKNLTPALQEDWKYWLGRLWNKIRAEMKKDLTNANIAEYIDNPADDKELHKKWVEGKSRVQAEEQARFAPVALITSASQPSTVIPPPRAANHSPEDDNAIQKTGLGTPPASPKSDSSDVSR
ncbi:hypothetical protein HK097_006812, partial [Rhizophlyctis rosea]